MIEKNRTWVKFLFLWIFGLREDPSQGQKGERKFRKNSAVFMDYTPSQSSVTLRLLEQEEGSVRKERGTEGGPPI